MGKFGSKAAAPSVTAPIRSASTTPNTYTHEGGLGFSRDAKSELFLLAVTNFVSEQTFYESGSARDDRFERLVEQVTVEDADWVRRFIPWLRLEALMRSASVVAACHYAKAGGIGAAGVIDAACQRADEPAEVLAYWHQRFGRRVPVAVKRGVARAVGRLYNERSALRYDGGDRAWRMGDVIELVHPKPKDARQSVLFEYLLDVRHHKDEVRAPLASLPMIMANRALFELPVEARRGVLNSEVLAGAGMSWERLSSWVNGPMDKEAWEAVIPSMGYMALLRNLRNFDEAGVSDEVAQIIIAQLTDPEEVARSRQFPFRFLSAYKAARGARWVGALEKALTLSLANVPSLPGRTLILVDCSGSMWTPMSGRSQLDRWEAAAVFGSSLALRAESATLVRYGTDSQAIGFGKGESVLRLVTDRFTNMGGTNTWQAVRSHLDHHDRIIILTDEQAHDSYPYSGEAYPGRIFVWNLAGYKAGTMRSGEKGRYTFGGLTDASFRLVPILEQYEDGDWPF